ncbi:MAG: oligosaccharide flippase family protein [Candidatus Marinimicrobia bacterium]|nr:oligosaccharide flippase family protein [Candidatus Neomarinimicrobiota bacterium]
MLKQIKSLTKQTLVYGVGTIATRMVTFLLLPVYTNVMPDEKYGQAALIFTFLALMNHVYNYGLDSAFMRYYSHENTEKDKTLVLSSAMIMAGLSSFVLSILVYHSRSFLAVKFLDDAAFDNLFIYAAGILFFDCLARVPFAFLRQERRPMVFMGVRFINVLLTLGLNIYFVALLKHGVRGIFFSNLITSFVTALLLFGIMIQKVRLTFSRKIAVQLFHFGVPFVPSGLAVAAMEMWNRMILKQYLGMDEVGIFSAAYKLGIFMLLIATGFYYAWQPFFLREGKKEESRDLFGRIMTYFVVVSLGAWVFLTAFINDIANIHIGGKYLLGLDYQSGVKIVPYILMGYVFYGINQVLIPGFYFEKKTKYMAIITIIAAVVNVALNYLLVPVLGILGPGFAMIAGNLALVIMSFFVSQKLFRVHYEYKRLLLLFVIFPLAGFLIYFLQPHVIIKIIVVLGLPLILKFFHFFNAGELGLLRKLVKRG